MNFPNHFRPIMVVAAAVNIILHGLAILVYRIGYWELRLFDDFRSIVFFFIFVSAALSIATLVSERVIIFRSIFVFRFLVVLVMVYSFGVNLTVGTCLLFGLLFEANINETFPANLVIDAAVLSLSAIVHRMGAVTLGTTNPGYMPELVICATSLILLSLSSSLITYYRERLIQVQSITFRLDSVVTALSSAQNGFVADAMNTRERSTIEERNRITREIHDSIGYTFTNVTMMLEASQDLAKEVSPRLMETLRSARELSRQGLDEIRKALYLLRGKEEGRPVGISAIHRLVRIFSRASKIHVDVEYSNMPMSSGAEFDSAIYHFVQEGLTNVLRHSDSTKIRIVFWVEINNFKVTMSDNGSGTANFHEGIGFLGMRERLGKLGGTLTIKNGVDGFVIAASIPKPGGLG